MFKWKMHDDILHFLKTKEPTCLNFQTSAHHLLGHAVRLSGEAAAHAAVQRQPVRALFCRDTNT